MVVCCCVTLLCSVTLGTSFPDVCVSVWVLWCPILNSGANVLCRDQPCSLRSALLSQLLACCWTQHCAKAQPGPGVPMGLH